MKNNKILTLMKMINLELIQNKSKTNNKIYITLSKNYKDLIYSYLNEIFIFNSKN